MKYVHALWDRVLYGANEQNCKNKMVKHLHANPYKQGVPSTSVTGFEDGDKYSDVNSSPWRNKKIRRLRSASATRPRCRFIGYRWRHLETDWDIVTISIGSRLRHQYHGRRMRKNLNLGESKAPRYQPNANIMTMLYPHLLDRQDLVTDYVILDMIG